MRLTYSIELELLLDSRVKIERVNSIELKPNSTITLRKSNKIKKIANIKKLKRIQKISNSNSKKKS